MVDNINNETFILISPEKFVICVNSEFNERIYEKKLLIKDNFNEINFQKLDNFLDENIFKIEKESKNFVKKTSIIIDIKNFFQIGIGIKKKNYDNIINLKNFSQVLYEARDYCKKTIQNRRIIHILVQKYKFDDKNFLNLPTNIKCKDFSLDIKFICISDNIIKNLEKILKKYQISVDHIVSGDYVKSFLRNEHDDIFFMAKDIINGHNQNEVLLVDRNPRYRGFFEKFFNFFS